MHCSQACCWCALHSQQVIISSSSSAVVVVAAAVDLNCLKLYEARPVLNTQTAKDFCFVLHNEFESVKVCTPAPFGDDWIKLNTRDCFLLRHGPANINMLRNRRPQKL